MKLEDVTTVAQLMDFLSDTVRVLLGRRTAYPARQCVLWRVGEISKLRLSIFFIGISRTFWCAIFITCCNSR